MNMAAYTLRAPCGDIQGRGTDMGLKNSITQATFAGAGFTHNANHGFVMNNAVEMFKNFLTNFFRKKRQI